MDSGLITEKYIPRPEANTSEKQANTHTRFNTHTHTSVSRQA